VEARACLVLVRNQPAVRLTTRERILGTSARSDTIVPPAPHVYETPLATVQRILTHSAELTELKVRRPTRHSSTALLIHTNSPDYPRVATGSATCEACR